MTLSLTSTQVWDALGKELFAVLGMVTAKGESRTVGIVYIVRSGKLYIASKAETWKVRHIGANPHVSLTVPIAKRIPIMPWVKIPAATITFSGTARIIQPQDCPPELKAAIFQKNADDPELMAQSCLIEVTPQGDFITYGVGVPLMQMRYPEKSRGRAPMTG